MRKAFLAVAALVALVVVAGAIVYTVPALRDEAEWRWAALKDAEDAYAAYLRERPDGRHAEEARQRHDDKLFDRAEAGDTIRDYEAYLKVYARGRHAGDARRRIDALHWQTARKTNTVASYQAYLATSPEGVYVAEAQTRFRDLRWKRTAARIASLACNGVASRRVPLYRAPSLSATLAAKRTPFYISYVVRITSAPATGYGVIARVPCEELDVLGGTAERGWAFAALKGKPAVKGWIDVPKASRVKWSIVPRVPADRLLTKSRRLPDLAFGAHTQSFQVGEECTNQSSVQLDPGGAVRESDEGNNSLSLSRPGSFYLSCGPIRRS